HIKYVTDNLNSGITRGFTKMPLNLSETFLDLKTFKLAKYYGRTSEDLKFLKINGIIHDYIAEQ
ncbi:7501_t:CDS:2, partial [Dentiscutata heterogama]